MTKVYIETILPEETYYMRELIEEVGQPEMVAMTLRDPKEGTRILCNGVIYEYMIEDVINGGESIFTGWQPCEEQLVLKRTVGPEEVFIEKEPEWETMG